MPVLMAGAMRVSTTRRASMPTGAPPNSSAGMVHCGCRAAAISLIARVVATASRKPPAPTNPATAGAAAMENAPRPIASRIAESPMSGLASAALNPGKYRPCGISTGAVNQASPCPATRMPKSVPLRAMAVTMVEPAMPRAGSRMLLPMAIATLRKNWSLAPMNSSALTLSASFGARILSKREVQATLRWCISSPIVRPRAISGFSGMPLSVRSACPRSGPNSSRSQASRPSTSASLPPKRITLPSPSLMVQAAQLPNLRFSTTRSGMLRVVMPVIGPTAPK